MYLVFGYHTYSPSGGWRDYLGATNTLQEAEGVARTYLIEGDVAQAVNASSRRRVLTYKKRYALVEEQRIINCEYVVDVEAMVYTDDGEKPNA